MTPDQAAYYAAGIIDGEGSIRHGRTARAIIVCNTDQRIIDAYCEALGVLGLVHTVSPGRVLPSGKIRVDVGVYGQINLTNASAILPLKSEKAEKLRRAVASYLYPRYTDNEIATAVEEHGSQRAAAKALGITRHTVQARMAKHY